MTVEAINRKEGIVLMTSGHTWPIANWLDDDGKECAEPDAVFAIVGPCNDKYRREFFVTLELSDFHCIQTN